MFGWVRWFMFWGSGAGGSGTGSVVQPVFLSVPTPTGFLTEVADLGFLAGVGDRAFLAGGD